MTEQENSLRGPVSLLPVASPFPSNIHDGHCQTIPLRAPESLPPVASPSTSHTVDSQPQHIDADQETSVISPGPLSPSTSPSISDIVDGPLQRIDIDQEPRLRESGSVLLSASPFPSNIVEDPRQPHLELTDIYQEPCLRVPGPLSLITSRFTTNAVKDNTQLQRIDLGQETREDCSQPQRTDIDRETLLQSPGPFSSIASGSAPSLNTGDGHTHTQCADYNDLIAMLSTPLLLASSMASVSSLGAVDEWARYIVASSTNLNMVEQAFPLVPEATSLQEALEAVFRPDAFADREQRVWAFAPRLIAVDPWAVDLLSKRGQVVPILRTSGSITQFFPELGDHD
ncbi:hypothetical protein H0H92_011274 [Tricholoma furcatifolium]|nr:hypothetical protein H0H92_011274 [Tricholoma furcatifolium]